MTGSTPLFSFAPPLVGALTLFVLFGYLHIVQRERFLALWTTAWGLWLVRLVYGTAVGGMQSAANSPVPRVLAMSYTTFVLLGAATFAGRRVMVPWLLIATPALLLRVLPPPIEHPTDPRLWAYALVLGTGWVWAGILFGGVDERLGAERWIPTTALVLMGLHQASIPLVSNVPGWEPWALNITLALQIGIGVGVLAAFNRRQRVELQETHSDLERALTRVLGGFVPICASCKSIRDRNDGWRSLEGYLLEHTDVSLSHGICPDCMATLYPEYLESPESPSDPDAFRQRAVSRPPPSP